MRQTLAEIAAIDAVGPFCRVRFSAPDLAAALEPGRAVLARWPDAYLRRAWWPCAIDADAFSVLAHPAQIESLRTGDRVDVLGPVGRGFQVDVATRNLLLVAGSTSLAFTLGPLLPLADRALPEGRSVTLAFAAPNPEVAYPVSSLSPAIEVIRAMDTDLIDLLSDAIAWADQVLACGPTGFTTRLSAHIRSIRRPAPRGFFQALNPVHLPCGVGACGVCRTGSRLACVDGPVFELNESEVNERGLS